jgi:hypothetical protein
MSKINTEDIQNDWKTREFVEIIKINVMNVVQFLNDFDSSIRYKLGTLNEKLNKIERNLEYCETSFNSAINEDDEY